MSGSAHVTAFYNLIGCRCGSAVSRKLQLMFYCFNFSPEIRFFYKNLIETNVNISNELNLPDVYRSVDYIWSLAKFTCTPSGLFTCTRPNVVYASINFRKMKFIVNITMSDITLQDQGTSYFPILSIYNDIPLQRYLLSTLPWWYNFDSFSSSITVKFCR